MSANATGATSSMPSSVQRIADSSRLTYKAGPLTRPISRSHMSSSSAASSSDTRDFLRDADIMRKELERKDARNASLSSEMQVLRTSYSSLQRELRMLSGNFEKVNSDRQRLSHELVKCKDYKDKLEVQLSRLGDVQHLTSQADRFQTERDGLEMELGNFRSLLASREDRLKVLERELEAFHRAIDVQAQYEGGNNRETVKSLYYELGKRQTDAHSLAISLAASNQELVCLKDSLREAVEGRAESLADLEGLRAHCSKVTQQNVRDKDELVAVQDRYEQLRGLSTRLQGQVEDLSRRLSEERLAAERHRAERERGADEALETQQRAQAEAKSLRSRVESLQKSLSQTESVRGVTERRLASEWARVAHEMEAMAERAQRSDLLEGELEAMRAKLRDAMHAKEQALAQVREMHESEALQLSNAALAAEVDQGKARLQELLGDKEKTVQALQQTMEAARELKLRYQAETTKRASAEERLAAAEERAMQAERFAESLNRAREHVSTAVLDALAKEKAKNATLERTILEMQNGDTAWPPPQQRPPPAPSPEPTVRPPLTADDSSLGLGLSGPAAEISRCVS